MSRSRSSCSGVTFVVQRNMHMPIFIVPSPAARQPPIAPMPRGKASYGWRVDEHVPAALPDSEHSSVCDDIDAACGEVVERLFGHADDMVGDEGCALGGP